MYKTLCVLVLLLPTFAFTQVVVAKGKFPNQTTGILKTTLFTPTEDGLYRVSAYATVAKTSAAGTQWAFNLGWTDDAGPQKEEFVLSSYSNQVGPFINDYNFYGGAVRVFEAKSGIPITFSLSQRGSAPNGAEYSLYYVLEQLE